MPSGTVRRRRTRKTVPLLLRLRRHRRQADEQPDERYGRERHDGEESTAPADILAEETSQRRRDRDRKRVAAIQQAKRARHLRFRHQAHDRRCRHRPEPADDDADERPARHEDGGVRREGDHHAREDHQQREAQQHRAAVDAARDDWRSTDWSGQRTAPRRRLPVRPFPRSLRGRQAMGVRRLTGMNSEAISVATQSVSAKTAPQEACLWASVAAWCLRAS